MKIAKAYVVRDEEKISMHIEDMRYDREMTIAIEIESLDECQNKLESWASEYFDFEITCEARKHRDHELFFFIYANSVFSVDHVMDLISSEDYDFFIKYKDDNRNEVIRGVTISGRLYDPVINLYKNGEKIGIQLVHQGIPYTIYHGRTDKEIQRSIDNHFRNRSGRGQSILNRLASYINNIIK